MSRVLLYSGGLDSWLINHLWNPDVKLYIDLGTKASKTEIEHLPSDVIIEKFDLIKHEAVDRDFYLPMRNLFLVTLASYYGEEICLGAEANDIHLDNNGEFAVRASSLLSYLASEEGRTIKVVTPFSKLTKTDMLQAYVKQGGSLDKAFKESFSCYSPFHGKECKVCSSCTRKLEAFKQLGYETS
jgi:7-cyano-7-deazaguanine synthase in queuosine biosynthesis